MALAIPSCTTEPGGTLSIALSASPTITSSPTLTLTGTVTRDPAKAVVIFIQATGGKGSPVDTVIGDHFTFPVPLNLNAVNTITLTAIDADRSSSNTVAVTVRHDGSVPTVVQATPANLADNVGTSSALEIKLSEPVVLAPGGGLELSRQDDVVAGVTSLSADSLTLTFAPAQALSPNAIYRLGFTGVSDVAGNAIPKTTSSCFVTATTGASSSLPLTDPTNDLFSSNPPPANQKPDLTGARFAREGPLFSGIFQFVAPRVFSRGTLNQASVVLDLDIDRDSTTGFVTQKDTIFLNSGPGFDTLSSGTRAEYVIALAPLPAIGDSAYVGRYTGPLQFQVAHAFMPGVCGSFMSFVVPFSLLGNSDGHLNAVVLAYAGGASGIYADPLPTKGAIQLDLPDPGPVSAWRVPGWIGRPGVPTIKHVLVPLLPLSPLQSSR